MDEEVIEPEFEYWSFDSDYVEEDWRCMSAWEYEGETSFDDDLRVRVNADQDDFTFIPPYQLFASEPKTYADPDTAYEEAVQYVQDLDVERLAEPEGGIE